MLNWRKWRHKIKYTVLKWMAYLGYEEPFFDYSHRRYVAMAAVLMEDKFEKKKTPIKITRIDITGSVFYSFEFEYLKKRTKIKPETVKDILGEKKDVYVNGNRILIQR